MSKTVLKRFAPFGWQGITFLVPDEWNLGKVSGDFSSGSFRLDDPLIVRLEAEWRSAKGSFSASTVVDKYVASLEKTAKKKGLKFRITRDVPLIQDGDSPENYECFLWEADYKAYNLVKRCDRCRRLILVKVFSRLKEDMTSTVAKILNTVNDHSEDGMNLWSVYNLYCRIPSDFKLEKYALHSGHLSLSFAKAKDRLIVDRYSLASLLLKDTTLESWFEKTFAKSLKEFDCSYTGVEIGRHSGLSLKAAQKSRFRLMLSSIPFNTRRTFSFLDGYMWECSDSNSIYVVQSYTKKRENSPSEVVTNEIVCHDKEKAKAYNAGTDAQLSSSEE